MSSFTEAVVTTLNALNSTASRGRRRRRDGNDNADYVRSAQPVRLVVQSLRAEPLTYICCGQSLQPHSQPASPPITVVGLPFGMSDPTTEQIDKWMSRSQANRSPEQVRRAAEAMRIYHAVNRGELIPIEN
jgi:hypothetical protein